MEDEIKSVEAQEPVTDNSAVIADILRAAGIEDATNEDKPAQEEVQESEPETQEEPEETEDNPTEEAGKDKPYTVEELIELGKSESMDKLDTSRIPPELQPVYKSLQAMSTRRQQTLAEKEKELDARLAKLTNAPASQEPPKPMEQRVYSDPAGVMREITSKLAETNAQLHKAQEADDIFEVQKLLIQKDTLKDQYLAVQEVVTSASRETEAVFKAIPNFQEKAPKLVAFTHEVLGDNAFTQDEISWLTNPLVTGKMSTKLVHLINSMYDMKEKQAETVKTAEEKLKKPKPTKSVAPGGGGVVVPTKNLKSLQQRAQTTNDDLDIAEYISAITKKG